jgi:hypothetical protein
MKKITLTISAAMLALGSIVNATTVSFTAQQGTAVSNLSGTALSGTTVDLGYYDTGTFTLLGSTTTADALPSGLFGGSSLFESTSLAAFQPAMRIFSDDGGSVIAYSTGWSFSNGDGSGTDIGADFFDLVNVVVGGSLTGTGVVLAEAGSTFNLNGAGNPTFGGSPSLEIGLVPEPSTYAALSGLLALGYVMVRRRRA